MKELAYAIDNGYHLHMEDSIIAFRHPQQPAESCPASSPDPCDPTSTKQGPRQVPSVDLLQGAKSVEIKHNGAVYRLQATKLGKLILTK